MQRACKNETGNLRVEEDGEEPLMSVTSRYRTKEGQTPAENNKLARLPVFFVSDKAVLIVLKDPSFENQVYLWESALAQLVVAPDA